VRLTQRAICFGLRVYCYATMLCVPAKVAAAAGTRWAISRPSLCSQCLYHAGATQHAVCVGLFLEPSVSA
jgi:hypothetical protein